MKRTGISQLCNFTIMLSLAFCLFGESPSSAQTNSTWNGSTGAWTDSFRWSTANYPNNGNGGLNYVANVHGGTVNVNVPITVNRMVQTGGTVNVNNPLNLLNGYNFSGGELSGTNTLMVGNGSVGLVWTGGVMNGTGTTIVHGGTFGEFGSGLGLWRNMDIVGTVNWQSDSIYNNFTSETFSILNSGTLNVTGNSWRYLEQHNIAVAGNLIHNNADFTYLFADNHFSNDGMVAVNSGTLGIYDDYYFPGGNTNGGGGSFFVDSGANLEFQYGNNSYWGNFSGNGTVHFSGGYTGIDGDYQVLNTVVTNGEASFNSAPTHTLQNVSLEYGVISGSSEIVINNLDWSGGGFSGSGVTTVQSGLFNGYGGGLALGREMHINGAVDWTNDNIYYGYSNPTALVVTNTGSLTSSGDSYRYLQADNVSVENGGQLINNNLGWTELVANNNFRNDGLVTVNNGTLSIWDSYYGYGDSYGGSGNFQVHNNAALEFATGDNIYSGNFSGVGTVRHQGGFTTITGNYDVANTEVWGGEFRFDDQPDRTFSNFAFNNGIVSGGSSLHFDNLNWSGGYFVSDTAMSVTNGTFGGNSSYLGLYRDMNITGNVQWLDSSIGSFGGIDVNVDNSAVLNVVGDDYRYISVDHLNIAVDGELAKNGNSILDIYGTVNNSGRISVNSGALQLYGPLANYSGTTLTGGTFDITGLMRIDGTTIETNQSNLVLNGANAEIQNHSNENMLASLSQNGPDGQLSIRDGKSLSVNNGFYNTGLLEIQGTASALNVVGAGVNGQFSQQGGETRLVDGGVLRADQKIDFAGGLLTGSGDILVTNNFSPAIDVQFDYGSEIAVGTSAGIIDIYGDTLIDGTMTFELGGLLVDGNLADIGNVNVGTDFLTTQFDQLNIHGDLIIGSSAILDVDLINGFAVQNGDFFDIITADSIVFQGNMNSLMQFMPSSGYSLSVMTLNDPVSGNIPRNVLRLTYSAIPEPGSAGMIIGLLWMAATLRRRIRRCN